MDVTNSSKATRGVYVGGNLVFLQPGQTRNLDLKGDELKEAKSYDALKFGAEKVEVKTDEQQQDELIAELAGLGIKADRRSNVETLQKRLDEALAK